MKINKDQVSQFIKPVQIEQSATKFSPLKKALISIGEWADSYLSLDSKKIVWKSKIDNKNTIWIKSEEPVTKSQLVDTLSKIAKVISYALLAPVIVALPAKLAYKHLYINPTVNCLPTTKTFKSDFNFTTEEKKAIVTKLPLWLESHFPEQHDIFVKVYEEFFNDLNGKSDEQIKQAFDAQIKLFTTTLSALYDKTPIMLRGLTVPKDDPKLAKVVESILINSWDQVIKTNTKNHYAWCNQGVMTNDSYQALNKVLNFTDKDKATKIRKEQDLDHTKCYPKLSMSMGGPRFTIGVSAP